MPAPDNLLDLNQDQIEAIARMLLDCDCLKGASKRESFAAGLPKGIRDHLDGDPRDGLGWVENLVRACLDVPNGLFKLLDRLCTMAGPASVRVQRIFTYVEALSPSGVTVYERTLAAYYLRQVTLPREQIQETLARHCPSGAVRWPPDETIPDSSLHRSDVRWALDHVASLRPESEAAARTAAFLLELLSLPSMIQIPVRPELEACVARICPEFGLGAPPGARSSGRQQDPREPAPAQPAPKRSPYRALNAFSESDAPMFFGRASLVHEMIATLRQERFLAILGFSGAGKSSLLMAGLLPQLKTGALPGSKDWRYYPVLVPGQEPLRSLARLLGGGPEEDEAHVRGLLDSPDYLLRALNEREGGPDVLAVDQFEELFTLASDPGSARAFCDNLAALVTQGAGRHILLVAMRADFEAYLTDVPALQRLFQSSRRHLLPMREEDLSEVILKPAEMSGLEFDPGVVGDLIRDVLSEPAGLPLLQFTLQQLWERRQGNRLTRPAYDALGGARLALARCADALFDQMLEANPEEYPTAERILLRIVRIGESGEVTGSRASRSFLYDTIGGFSHAGRQLVDRVLRHLIDHGLLRVTPGETREVDQVEVAHEALVRNWARLAVRINEQRVDLIARQRFERLAAEWMRLGRRAGFLDAVQLGELRQWLETPAAHYLGYERELEELARESQAAIDRAVYQEESARLQKESSRLQALALRFMGNSQDLALLLAREAHRAATAADHLQAASEEISSEAWQTLLTVLGYYPQQVAFLRRPDAFEFVYGVIFSPDRCHLATTYADGGIAIWDVWQPTAPLAQLWGLTGEIDAIQFSPGGEMVVAGDRSGNFCLWDIASVITGDRRPGGGGIVEAAASHRASDTELEMWSIALSPNGRTVASAYSDGTVRLWSLDPVTQRITVQPQHTFRMSRGVIALAFSPDGRLLATGGKSKRVALWDVEDGGALGEELRHADHVYCLAFDPSGRILAAGVKNGTIALWNVDESGDAATAGRLEGEHTALIWSVAFHPDGQELASAGKDATVVLWNVATRQPLTRFTGHSDQVNSVAFHPDGVLLASASDDRTAQLWDLSRRTSLAGHEGDARCVAFCGDGHLLASGARDRTIRLWARSPATGKFVSPPRHVLRGHVGDVTCVAFHPGGAQLTSGGDDGWVRFWDAQTGTALGRQRREHRATVTSIVFSPVGDACFSSDRQGRIVRWELDPATGQPLRRRTILSEQYIVWSLAISPDGQWLISAGDDQTIAVWDAHSLRSLIRFEAHSSRVNCVAFHPNGRVLASGGAGNTGADNTLRFWETADRARWRLIGEPRPFHENYLSALAFSGDGNLLASASWDKTFSLWDVTDPAKPHPRARFHGHGGIPNSLGFCPQERTLAVSSESRVITLWHFEGMEEWNQDPCAVANRNLTPAEWDRYLGGERPYRPTCDHLP